MNTVPEPYRHQEDEIDLVSIFHELRGYKWLLLLTMTIGLVLGAFYAMRQPTQYESNVLLQIDGGKGGSGKNGGLADQFLSANSSGDSAATQMALIQSRFILEPVVEILGLNIQCVPRVAGWKVRLFPWLSKQQATLTVERFDIPDDLLNHRFLLRVEQAGEVVLYDENDQRIASGPVGDRLLSPSGNIQLQVVTEDDLPIGTQFKLIKRPQGAIVNGLSNRLKIEEAGARGVGTGILDLSLKGTNKQQVFSVLNTIADIAQAKDAEKKAQEASQTLSFLEHQLPITKKLLEESERALNHYRAKSGKIDIKIQTQFLLEQMANLEKQLNELQVRSIEIQQKFKKTHPVWIALETQIKALKAQRVSLESELKQLPASDQVAVNLMRDVEVKQSLYLLLLNKIQELQVVKAGTVSGLHILSYAHLPDKPLPIKKRLITLGGGLFGLMMGVLFILGRKLFYPRVNDPHWSEKQLGIPNVAIIPFCKEQVESTALGKHVPLLAHLYPKNLAIEALRSLRTSLQVTLACANNNLISILGVAPSVGKTFVSCNLGYLLAAAGKRVLLIDSDLRRGTLHKYFNLDAKLGLSDFLEQQDSLDFDPILKSSMHENLKVVTRGYYPKDPSELLSGDKFKQFVETVSSQFDVVMFDTAPVLLVTDATLVSGFSATNFLVVGAGVHQPSDIELAMKRLKGAGIVVNGAIFNFHKEQSRGYYGQYYNYSYYYHDENELENV